jgi:spore coat protein U-like protein
VFDILYICSGEGGLLSVPVPVRDTGSVRINVNTVSALQAYYAGAALDFGEIGDATTAAVQGAPERYTTSSANTLRVRSSGPFEVRVRSQNDFRLTFPGGNLTDTAQTIRYSARFLGQDVTSNASFGTKTCVRAGIGGEAGTLPLRATLQEGGSTKTPAPNYADTISITFTPIVTASSAVSCAGL